MTRPDPIFPLRRAPLASPVGYRIWTHRHDWLGDVLRVGKRGGGRLQWRPITPDGERAAEEDYRKLDEAIDALIRIYWPGGVR